MTPLERAARALALYVPDQIAEEAARAVIAAIREPSRAMFAAFDNDGSDVMVQRGEAIDKWTTMIDALLEQGR